MRLTAFSDYALRVLMLLACAPGQRITIRQIADRYNVSRHHMMKVVNLLTRAGLVHATRGQNGGLCLAREAGSIGVGEVIRLTEDDLAIVECFRPDNRCVLTPACNLKQVLAEALQSFMDVLDRYTIADLAANADELRNLLFLDAIAGEPS